MEGRRGSGVDTDIREDKAAGSPGEAEGRMGVAAIPPGRQGPSPLGLQGSGSELLQSMLSQWEGYLRPPPAPCLEAKTSLDHAGQMCTGLNAGCTCP